MYLTFRVKADHAEKVIRKHIDKLFHKDRETRRKDKWRNTRNFFDSGTKNKKDAAGNGYLSDETIANRASDALLNYMEACYEKNGNLDAKAQSYWRAFRERAHPDTDYNKTIAATVMSEEAKNDWERRDLLRWATGQSNLV